MLIPDAVNFRGYRVSGINRENGKRTLSYVIEHAGVFSFDLPECLRNLYEGWRLWFLVLQRIRCLPPSGSKGVLAHVDELENQAQGFLVQAVV